MTCESQGRLPLAIAVRQAARCQGLAVAQCTHGYFLLNQDSLALRSHAASCFSASSLAKP